MRFKPSVSPSAPKIAPAYLLNWRDSIILAAPPVSNVYGELKIAPDRQTGSMQGFD
jgi:hypothetical protein